MLSLFIGILLLSLSAAPAEGHAEEPVKASVQAPAEQAAARGSVELELWPGKDFPEGTVRPTLTAHLPPPGKPARASVVVCPGGGYGHLAVDHEGRQVAEWLNGLGIAAFVLRYRHGKPHRHPEPLMDAQRALARVRHDAAKWELDPDRIGILGFSAGGHLASSAGTLFHEGDPEAEDPLDRVSCRPDFMILVYPVITLEGEAAHRGSRRNLLGDDPAPELIERLSTHRQVTKRTPPTFLVHATDDRGVPVENTLLFYRALVKAGVPAELHVFPKGGHGFGLGKKGSSAAAWPGLCARWLKRDD